MTLPTNIILPDSREAYLQSLVYALSTYLQQANYEANGTLVTLTETSTFPFIIGSVSAGTATYSSTVLFTHRSNLITRAWFDISWTLHTGTGNILISLPYYAQTVPQQPFVGPIEASSIAFSPGYTYLTGNLLPDTNTIEIRQSGSGVPSIALPLPAAGTLRGSMIYDGQTYR